MKPVQLGLVGCGVIGQAHLRAAASLSHARFVAVCDVRKEAAEHAAIQHGIANVYTDVDDLFAAPDIQGVVLALPAHLRTDLALRAFATGKHVLTEKPVAMNAGEVRMLIAARGELVAGCCSSRMRFLPSAQVATDFIASGALGKLRLVRCRALVAAREPPATLPPPWRLNRSLNGGGILMNWGCYDLDYLFGILGWTLQPQRVLAHMWTNVPAYAAYAAPGSDAETHVTALVECAGDIALSYERGEFMPTQTDEAWQIIGEQGALRLRMTPGAQKQIFHDTVSDHGTLSRVLWEGDEDWEPAHRGPVADFAAAIIERRQPLTSLEQALVIQQLTDAIYQAATCGECVEVK